MKKLLLTIGAAAAAVAPIAAVVACSNTEKPAAKNNKKTNVTKNNDAQKAEGTAWTEITKNANKIKPEGTPWLTVSENAKEIEVNPFKDVADDGIYLWDKTYDGTLLDNQTLKDGIPQNGIVRVGETGYGLTNSIQLGKRDPKDATQKEDSIYMVYDKDDEDGINIDNFTDTFFFEDTSIAMDEKIRQINNDVFGNVSVKGGMFGNNEYVKFTENNGEKYQGHINNYFGSQNNHVSVGEGYSTNADFMKKMKAYAAKYKDTNPEVINALLKYYGLKTTPEADGTYAPDPSILNHASLGFAPVYYDKPIFTYEKVFDNVIKITYHDQGDFQVTAAHFRLKQQDGSYEELGSLSLGHNDWSSYYGHSEAKYVATKKIIDAPKVVTGEVQKDGSKVFADIKGINAIKTILETIKAYHMNVETLNGMLNGVGASNIEVKYQTQYGPYANGDTIKFDFNGVSTQAIFDGTEFTFKQ